MSTIKKNVIYSMLYQILVLIVPIITTPYLARTLGAENQGIYAYAYSIVQYFALFIMLGISDHGNRSVANVRDNPKIRSEIFWSIYLIQAIASVLVITIYIIYIFVSKNEYRLIFLIQLLYLISVALDINWYFWGMEQFKITVTRNTVIKLVFIAVIFIFVHNTGDLLRYVLIMACVPLLSNLVLWLFLRKQIDSPCIVRLNMARHIKACLILFIPLVARSVFVFMDKIMLGVMNTMTQVAIYDNAEKIVLAPTSIITAIGTVMLPRLSNLIYNHKYEESKHITKISIDIVMILSMAFLWGILSVADIFIPLYLGKEFSECAKVFKMMAFTIPLVGWTNVIRTQYIIPMHMDKKYMISVILGAIANFCVNYIMIPYHGAYGAAAGWIVAELIICIYQTVCVKGQLPIFSYIKDTFSYNICGFVMYMLIIKIPMQSSLLTTILIRVFAGALIYGICLVPYVYLENKELLFEIFKRKGIDSNDK